MPHGAEVVKKLVAPWAGTKRVICANSYCGSVRTGLLLLTIGLRFSGVVKTATHVYPMGTLSDIPLQARGEHVSYKHANVDGIVGKMAVLRMDRNCRYFVITTSM